MLARGNRVSAMNKNAENLYRLVKAQEGGYQRDRPGLIYI
jgi:hypothetical protein